ncbi:MAG: hypothetical protein ACYS8K_02195 [Planctomycetota bacterium]|jgi:hypothetical protein
MLAYIIGMITGTICLVFPLIYAMSFDRAVAKLLSRQPEFAVESFGPHVSGGLLYIVAIIGAIVLLISTLLVALSGMTQLKERRARLRPAQAPALAPEEPLDLTLPEEER